MTMQAKASSERLQRFKARTKYTQDELAERFGVDPVSIRHWLSGAHEMRPEHLQKLLRMEADFLCGTESPLSPAGKKAFVEGRHGYQSA